MELVGADTLFAASHEPEAKQPFIEGNFAVLEYRADRYGELLAA